MPHAESDFLAILHDWIELNDIRVDRQYQIDRYHVDFTFRFRNTVFLIEIDEHEHRDYDMVKDMDRLTAIRRHEEKRFSNCVLLRYNPDSFIVGDMKYNCCPRIRQQVMVEFFNSYIPTQPFEIWYAFYSTSSFKGRLTILDHEYYGSSFQYVSFQIPVDQTCVTCIGKVHHRQHDDVSVKRQKVETSRSSTPSEERKEATRRCSRKGCKREADGGYARCQHHRDQGVKLSRKHRAKKKSESLHFGSHDRAEPLRDHRSEASSDDDSSTHSYASDSHSGFEDNQSGKRKRM